MSWAAWLFPGGAGFSRTEGVVLAGLWGAMLVLAWLASRKSAKTSDFFQAGRTLSWPRACAALVAAETSTLTLLSLTAATFAGDWSLLRLFAAAAAARLAIVWLYLPLVYPESGPTLYAYLSRRFGPSTERVAAGLFLGMRLLASGARLAAGAAVVGALLGCRPVLVVLAVAAGCAAYTGWGGLRAVVAASALQAAVMITAPVLALFFIARHCGGGMSAVWQAAQDAGRLGLGTPGADFTLAPAFFIGLATFGADQELAQSVLASRTLGDSRKAMGWAVAASLLISGLYLGLGTALYAYFRLNPGLASPSSPDLVLAHFTLTSLPAAGRALAVAALAMAAAHLPLCSLAAVFVEDFYRPWLRPRRSEAHYLRVGRTAVWFFAAAVSALALLWGSYEPWLAFALRLGSVLLGPLLGLFLFALFSRLIADRANVVAAAVATGAGAVVLALIESGSLSWDPNWIVAGGALLTAFLARGLSGWLDPDQ